MYANVRASHNHPLINSVYDSLTFSPASHAISLAFRLESAPTNQAPGAAMEELSHFDHRTYAEATTAAASPHDHEELNGSLIFRIPTLVDDSATDDGATDDGATDHSSVSDCGSSSSSKRRRGNASSLQAPSNESSSVSGHASTTAQTRTKKRWYAVQKVRQSTL